MVLGPGDAVPVTKAIQLLGIDHEYGVGLAQVHSFGHARVKWAASAPLHGEQLR